MIIQNSLHLLQELTELEEKIAVIEEVIHTQGPSFDTEEYLSYLLKNTTRLK